MFILYYLANQTGDIYGDKHLVGTYANLASAQAKALADGVTHYSVETDLGNSQNFCIVYLV